MSRSYRKTSIVGVAYGASEKQDKRFANRKLRRKIKSSFQKDDFYDENYICPEMREVSDTWGMSKDGKYYFDENKNSTFKKMMRK